MSKSYGSFPHVLEDMNCLIGARVCITLIRSGNPVRFKSKVDRVLEGDMLPENYSCCYGLRMSSFIDARFGLWKERIVFFNSQTMEWLGYADDVSKAGHFIVEVVGWIYNYSDYFNPDSWIPSAIWHDKSLKKFTEDHSVLMDKLDISISGDNIRAILFKKIYNDEWQSSGYTTASIMKVKGSSLLDLLKKLMRTKQLHFTLDEVSVIRSYLFQDKVLNPPSL
jgi:hypothetical protein